MDGRTDGWMGALMHGWMDGWMVTGFDKFVPATFVCCDYLSIVGPRDVNTSRAIIRLGRLLRRVRGGSRRI